MGWVTERYNCTLNIAFRDIRDHVENDVKEANVLASKQSSHPTFVMEDGNGGLKKRFAVRGMPLGDPGYGGQIPVIVFELHENRILIDRSSRPETLKPLQNITVTQGWDAIHRECLLFVDGNVVIPQEVSAMALEPLFFG